MAVQDRVFVATRLMQIAAEATHSVEKALFEYRAIAREIGDYNALVGVEVLELALKECMRAGWLASTTRRNAAEGDWS